jgi:radical SAM superfamily enzyme YgiQ (UPF0313 family)
MQLTIGLVQLNSTLSWTRQRFQGRHRRGPFAPAPQAPAGWSIFPYSIGLLQAYVQAHAPDPRSYRFLPPLFREAEAAACEDLLRGADVAGFSLYVWNEQRSMAAAMALKAASPGTLIVAGGPQVPDDAAPWMASHPYVDIAVHGEGEAAFLALLEACRQGLPRPDWGAVPSISWRDKGVVRTNERIGRISDLDSIPSPYLTGVFSGIMAARPDERWIMLWETNRGCPFSCSFCDWGSATASKVFRFDMARLEQELEWFAGERGELIFCCDANFGMLPRDVHLARYAAAVKQRTGYPRTISVQNTKNATDRAYEVHRALHGAGMHGGVTLALQSVDAGTLAAVRRDNISLDSFRELQRRFRADGIPTYSDMILALPGESYDSFASGIERVISEGQHTRIQFYNCAILPNAPMAEAGYREEYGLETVPQRLLGDHVPVEEADDGECIEVVVSTRAMPAADWRRAKLFWWYTDLLFYNRLLNLPFVLIDAASGVGVRALIESVMDASGPGFPELERLRQKLDAHAAGIQGGGPEPIASAEWLNVWWPADQWAIIDMVTRFRTEAVVRESEAAVRQMLVRRGAHVPDVIIGESFRLAAALFAQPFELDDEDLELGYDVPAAYDAVLRGEPLPEVSPATGTIIRAAEKWLDWEAWLEHVIFCHNQKASYQWRWRAAAPATRIMIAQ